MSSIKRDSAELTLLLISFKLKCVYHITSMKTEYFYLFWIMILRDIKDLTPVRGKYGKISDTQGKDFWSPTRLC